MRKNIRVEVTQEDIDEGMRRSSISCAIARRISAIVGRVVTVLNRPAGDSPVAYTWDDDGSIVYWELTQKAGRWIKAFDAGEPVKPFVTWIRGI